MLLPAAPVDQLIVPVAQPLAVKVTAVPLHTAVAEAITVGAGALLLETLTVMVFEATLVQALS